MTGRSHRNAAPRTGFRATRRAWIAFSLLLVAATANAQPAPNERSLTLLITSGLAGKLVSEDDRSSLAVVAAAIRSQSLQASARGSQVLVLDLGRTLGPYAESRWDGGRTILDLLKASGAVVFAPDAMDLTIGKAKLETLQRESEMQFLVPETIAAGELSGEVVLRVDGFDPALELRFRVFSDPRHENNYRASGFDPISEEVEGSAQESRPDRLEIGIVRSYGTGSSLVTRPLTWNLLEQSQAVDLWIDPDLGHDLSVQRDTDSGPVHLVGRIRDRDDPWSLARLDLRVEANDDGWRIEQLDLQDVSLVDQIVDSELDARLRQVMADFRQGLAAPLDPAAPQDLASLHRFVLESMREALKTEVAVLNRGALRPIEHVWRAGETLTREVVFRLLSLEQDVHAIELSGSQLSEIVDESSDRVGPDGTPRSNSLVFVGVDDFGTTVNGRPLVSSDPYRVATNTFLLTGGDNYSALIDVGESELAAETIDGRALRDQVVLPRLEHASRPFVDLSRKGLWRFGVDRLDLSLSGVETRADASYRSSSDSRARATDSRSTQFDLELRADLLKIGWTFENRFRGRYGNLDTQDGGSFVTDDSLELDSSLVFTKVALAGGRPYVGTIWTSELKPERDSLGELRPRRFERTLAAGAHWSTRHWPRLRAGLVYRSYSGIERPDQLGLFGEARLEIPSRQRRPGLLARLKAEHLTANQSDLDRLDIELRGLFPMFGQLSLTPGVELYWLDESERTGAARYYGLTLGFSYRWSGKRQMR